MTEETPAPARVLEGDEWVSLRVSPAQDGGRVDRLVAQAFPAVGRKLAARLCDERCVLIDGRPTPKGAQVQAGQTVAVRLSSFGEAAPAPDVPLHVVLQRDDLVVVEKEAGVPAVALVGHEEGTLAGALLSRYPEMKGVGYSPREPGLLHRLDTFTSGLLVAARNAKTFDVLREALSRGEWQKKYLALVAPGSLPEGGSIEAALAPDPKNKQKVTVIRRAGHDAKTEFTVLKRGSHCDLVEVQVGAAYRHQVRVHLAHLGAPLLGDALYGGAPTQLLLRHALHANYIACRAEGVEAFEAEIPLAADLASLLVD